MFERILLTLIATVIFRFEEVVFLNEAYAVRFARNCHRLPTVKQKGATIVIQPVFPQVPRVCSASIGMRVSHVTVLYVGNFAKVHAIEFALEVIQEFRQEIVCDIVGKDRIGRQAELGQAFGHENIRFHGYVDDVAPFFRKANLGLGLFGTNAKSLDSDSNKIFEYLASGLPVITRRNNILPRYFPEESGIFYISEREDLRALLTDVVRNPARLSAAGEAGRHRLEQLKTAYPTYHRYRDLWSREIDQLLHRDDLDFVNQETNRADRGLP